MTRTTGLHLMNTSHLKAHPHRLTLNDVQLISLTTIATLIVLMIDLMIPLGVAMGALYILPVLVTLFSENSRAALFASVVSTLLIGLGYVVSPEGGVRWITITNRMISVTAVWVTYVVVRQTLNVSEVYQSFQRQVQAELESNAKHLQAEHEAMLTVLEDMERTQYNLQESEERNRLLLTSAGEGIWGVDLDGRTTFINPWAARVLGYEPEELIGVVMHEVVHHTKPDGSSYPKEDCPMYAAYREGAVQEINDEVL